MPLCRPNVVEPGWRVLEVSKPPLEMPVPAVPSFGGAASSDDGGAAGLKAGAGAGAPVSQPGRRTVSVQSLFQVCRSPSELYAKLSQASANRASPTSGQASLPPLVAPRQPLFDVTFGCNKEYPMVGPKCSGEQGGFVPHVTVPDCRLLQSAGDSPILPDDVLMPLSSPSCLPSFLQPQTIASKRNGQQLAASTTPVTELWAKPRAKRKSSSGTEAEVQEAVQEEVQEEAVVDDCGSCRYCLDKQKFGGQHRLRQKCELKTWVQRQTKARSQAAKSGLAREQHELTWQPTNAMQVDLVQRDAAKRSAKKKSACPCLALHGDAAARDAKPVPVPVRAKSGREPPGAPAQPHEGTARLEHGAVEDQLCLSRAK